MPLSCPHCVPVSVPVPPPPPVVPALQKFAPPYTCHVSATADDAAAAAQGLAQLRAGPGPRFVWVHLRGLEAHYERVKHVPPTDKKWAPVTDVERELLGQFDAQLHDLVGGAPDNTLFLIWSGQGPIGVRPDAGLPRDVEDRLRAGYVWLHAKGERQKEKAALQAKEKAPTVDTKA